VKKGKGKKEKNTLSSFQNGLNGLIHQLVGARSQQPIFLTIVIHKKLSTF
jgi:hypothetical protein